MRAATRFDANRPTSSTASAGAANARNRGPKRRRLARRPAAAAQNSASARQRLSLSTSRRRSASTETDTAPSPAAFSASASSIRRERVGSLGDNAEQAVDTKTNTAKEQRGLTTPRFLALPLRDAAAPSQRVARDLSEDHAKARDERPRLSTLTRLFALEVTAFPEHARATSDACRFARRPSFAVSSSLRVASRRTEPLDGSPRQTAAAVSCGAFGLHVLDARATNYRAP